MNTPGSLSRNGWFVLGMLWLVCLLNYADRQVIGSLFPLLERDFGFTKAQLGLIGSSFMWVYAASAPVAGFLGDRYSRKRLIFAGCLFWSLLTGMTGFCGRLWQFLGVRSLIGLGESFYFPSATSLLGSLHGERTRSTALSIHQSAVYVGTIAGGGLGAVLAEEFGWRSAFWAFGMAGILLSLLLAIVLRDPFRSFAGVKPAATSHGRRSFLKTQASLLSRPEILMLGGAFAFSNGVAAIFLVWAPTFLFEKFQLGLVGAGFSAVLAVQVSSAVSAPLAGLLSDRLAARLRGARILVQATALLLGAGCVVAVGNAPVLGILMVAMLGFGFCKGGYDAGIFASVFEFVEPGERASVAGLMNTIGWAGGAIGTFLFGWFSGGGGSATGRMSTALAWSALSYLIAASLLLAALRCYRSSPHWRAISSPLEPSRSSEAR